MDVVYVDNKFYDLKKKTESQGDEKVQMEVGELEF